MLISLFINSSSDLSNFFNKVINNVSNSFFRFFIGFFIDPLFHNFINNKIYKVFKKINSLMWIYKEA
jgi:hypothetical protein